MNLSRSQVQWSYSKDQLEQMQLAPQFHKHWDPQSLRDAITSISACKFYYSVDHTALHLSACVLLIRINSLILYKTFVMDMAQMCLVVYVFLELLWLWLKTVVSWLLQLHELRYDWLANQGRGASKYLTNLNSCI